MDEVYGFVDFLASDIKRLRRNEIGFTFAHAERKRATAVRRYSWCGGQVQYLLLRQQIRMAALLAFGSMLNSSYSAQLL
jgi:hypothetical protein